MSKQDVEKIFVITELQKIFSLRKKLTNKVCVIKCFNGSNVYIDREGYFIEWNEGDTERKTIKKIVSIFVYLNYKQIEAVRKGIEETVGKVAQ